MSEPKFEERVEDRMNRMRHRVSAITGGEGKHFLAMVTEVLGRELAETNELLSDLLDEHRELRNL